jgi:hypothetical protein
MNRQSFLKYDLWLFLAIVPEPSGDNRSDFRETGRSLTEADALTL